MGPFCGFRDAEVGIMNGKGMWPPGEGPPGNPVLPFRSSAPRLVLVALSSTCSLETEGLTVALEQTFPALQLTRCVTLGKLLGLSVPGFPWCISFL